MNGELLQICQLTAAVKNALKSNTPIEYVPSLYENKPTFQCLKEESFFLKCTYQTITDISTWFDQYRKKGLRDVKLSSPISFSKRKRNLLGFSNTQKIALVCMFENGKSSLFTPSWSFQQFQRKWNILYTEQNHRSYPKNQHFEDNTKAFQKVLSEIKFFALKIGDNGYANIFQKALDLLNGATPENKIDICLPEKHLRLFNAANISYVFGGMGSWNDDAYGMAYEQGLRSEYNRLSSKLLENVYLAILYAINEW